MLQLPVTSVQLSPLWSIMAHYGPSAEMRTFRPRVNVPGLRARVITAEFSGVRTRRQHPPRGVCPCPYLACRAGLTPFAHRQPPPRAWAISIPVSFPVPLVDTFLSPELGWLNNNIPVSLSPVPVTAQIPVDRHIWGGVGSGDGLAWMDGCFFAVCSSGQTFYGLRNV